MKCRILNTYQDMELSHYDRLSQVSENESGTCGKSDTQNLDRDKAYKLYRQETVLTKSEVLNCSMQGPQLDEILTLSNLLKHYNNKLTRKTQKLFNKYKFRQRFIRSSKLLLGIILGCFLHIIFTKLSKTTSQIEVCRISKSELYYEGNCINGIPYGKGTAVYSSGITYVGDFADGYRTGNGFIRFPNGDIYRGQFKNDLLYGKGTIHGNGSIYEGNFIDSKLDGQGSYVLSTGEKYVGEFKQNLKHGIGKLTNSHGDVYEGSFKKDVKNGYGVMKYSNGGIYEGKWQKNKPKSKSKSRSKSKPKRNRKGKMI